MTQLDLSAPIIPSVSAGGFSIGMSIEAISPSIKGARTINYYDGFNLVQAIAENTGMLVVYRTASSEGATIYFGQDIVRLVFSKEGLLSCIYVFSGYLGSYDTTKIGQPLSQVPRAAALSYDDGDEMYYLKNAAGEYEAGLAIVALPAEKDEYPETQIEGFSIHDWSLFKRT